MPILKKIIKLSALTASSLLKNEEPEKLHNSKLFSEEDKKYIIHNLTDKKVLKDRAQQLAEINLENDWKKIQESINVPVRKIFYWKYAAAAAVIIFAGTMYFSQNHLVKSIPQNKTTVAEKSVIKPGTDKAVLVLASGEQIILGKGEQYNSANVHSNGKEIVYNSSPN